MLTTHTKNGICRHTDKSIPVPHGMFARSGGASIAPYDSLNLSYGVGDEEATVLENRDRLKQILDIDYLISSQQVHGDRVAVVEQADRDLELAGFDALITNQAGTGLLIQQADCQAILLYDPDKQVIAAIHNGWRGSVTNIIAKTITALEQHFKIRPEEIRAAISPSLGPCCGEFINYRKELPLEFLKFQVTENHFDFWAISRWQLKHSGINTNNIMTAGICTACNKDFFSYRRAVENGNGVTGRNGSVIALPRIKTIKS